MSAIVIGIITAFIVMYFLEGKIEVQQRTHNLLNRLAVKWRKYNNDRKKSINSLTEIKAAENIGKELHRRDSFLFGVACTLGESSDEDGAKGLKWIHDEARDGDCDLAEIGLKNSGRITNNKTGTHYFYFKFNIDVVERFRRKLIYIIAEYYDKSSVGNDNIDEYLGVAYDSVDGDTISARFKPSGFIQLKGDDRWKEAIFSIKDGAFLNRANGADFRICLRHVNFETKTELILRRVAVIAMD